MLRLVDKPLENVEATGVDTAVVERMEESLKKDVRISVLFFVRLFTGKVDFEGGDRRQWSHSFARRG